MKGLFMLMLILSASQAQAYCKIKDTSKNTKHSATLEINLDDPSKILISSTMNFDADISNFFCTFIGNYFTTHIAEGNKEYKIKYSANHFFILQISLKANTSYKNHFNPGDNQSAASLNSAYSIKTAIIDNPEDLNPPEYTIGEEFPLREQIIIKPAPCSISCGFSGNNNKDQYINNIIVSVKFTPTTCTLTNNSLIIPNISAQEIDTRGYLEPATQPEIACSSKFGFASSNVKYYFAADNIGGNNVLRNVRDARDSAGEVGFALKSNGINVNVNQAEPTTTKIFSRYQALKSTSYPLSLTFKYTRYGSGKAGRGDPHRAERA